MAAWVSESGTRVAPWNRRPLGASSSNGPKRKTLPPLGMETVPIMRSGATSGTEVAIESVQVGWYDREGAPEGREVAPCDGPFVPEDREVVACDRQVVPDGRTV